MTQPLDLGTLEITPDPIASSALMRRHQDQRELYRRIGAKNLVEHASGRRLSPEALADSRRWAAFPVLDRPLGTGEPE